MSQIIPGSFYSEVILVSSDGCHWVFVCSDISARQSDVYSERHSGYPERQSNYPSFGLGNQFAFKLKVTGRDGKERNHRFNCGGYQSPSLLF